MTAYSSESLVVVGRRDDAGLLVLHALVDQQRGVAAVIQDHVRGPEPSGQRSIWSVHHQYSGSVSPFQAKTGTPDGASGRAVPADGDRRGGVVLGGEDVAGRPADVRAEIDEGLDQHGGLHGHVQRTGDPGPGQRSDLGVFAAQRHQAGHLVFGEGDLLAAEVGQRQRRDLEVEIAVTIDRQVGGRQR